MVDALISRGLEVHLLVRGESLMGKQLDPQASAIFAAHLQARGMHIHWRSQVARCLGQAGQTLEGLETQDGQIIPCQLALEAVGTIANDAIARACGLPQAPGGGIVVDDALHTVDPHISAGGECASVAGQRYGTTAAASAMAQVILHQACGRLQRRFQGFQDANILKIHGFACVAIGDTAGTHPDDQVVLCADPSQSYYQKRILRHGSLVGAICMGNADDFPSLCELVRSGVELDPDTRRQLLRPDSASSLAPPVEGALVCSCMRIGADTITRLAPDCSSPQALCTKSKAGTGCGSCKPEVTRIWQEARVGMDEPLATSK